jgi:diguanylate cyclase (GGDEF)-like protein
VVIFAFYAAAALALAAASVLWFTRSYSIKRAERNARFHAGYVADTVLRDRLLPSDFERPVSPHRRAQLDRLFRREVLVEGSVRAKLYNRRGLVTYSTDRQLIGTRPGGGEPGEALRGEAVSDVTGLNAEGGSGENLKVLETYAAVRLGGRRPVGVFELYQDYGPIAQAAREMFVPISGVLGLVLVVLYVSLFPILRRATRRLARQMEEIEHQARHDALTDLPNRAFFRQRVEAALAVNGRTADSRGGQRRGGEGLAVMLIDLDRFKEINDTLGHESGDLLLRDIGQRLATSVRESDTVARLGGDEFGLLALGAGSEEAALAVAHRLRRTLETPFSLRGLQLEVEASIGIALVPDHGRDVDTLIRNADVAMYVSKELHSGAEVYSSERDDYSPDRLRLVGELRGAISRGEFVLHYQPQLSLATGEVSGFEALVRWEHPELGLLGPDRFVPIAEHTGLIRPLTRYVLEHALRQCRAWGIQGLEVAVAVNLSGRDLLDVNLPDEVEALLGQWRIEPRRLELEITESTILSDPVRTRAILGRLEELGVRLAIDDFGSGYSSVGYLKRLPLDTLKIDKSFVLSMLHDDDDAAIVRSTIDLAHNLGLRVIAEGVETNEALQALVSLRCDTAQGFFFSRPLPALEVPRWLAESRRAADAEPIASGEAA